MGLVGGVVDSDMDVGDVWEVSEEVVEFGVGGFVGDVIDEKLIGGGIRCFVLFVGMGSLFFVFVGNVGYLVFMLERVVDSGVCSVDGGGVFEGDKVIFFVYILGVVGNVGVFNFVICFEGFF